MLRRRRIGSQSVVDSPLTRTSPELGTRSRLMSLREVVLPDPLRPSSTRGANQLSPVLQRWERRKKNESSPGGTAHVAQKRSRVAPLLGMRFVRRFRQPGYTHAAMSLMPDVEPNQQSR